MMTLVRTIATVAQFANAHPRLVILALLTLAAGLVGLAAFGAVSLVLYPSLPKVFCFAAVAVAAWLAIRR
jgi:hypothetical protein